MKRKKRIDGSHLLHVNYTFLKFVPRSSFQYFNFSYDTNSALVVCHYLHIHVLCSQEMEFVLGYIRY